jgi:hypothetical protein
MGQEALEFGGEKKNPKKTLKKTLTSWTQTHSWRLQPDF